MSALTGVQAAGAVGTVGKNITVALKGVGAIAHAGTIGAFAHSGEGLALRAPLPTAAFTGVTGTVGTVTLLAPKPTLALAGATPFLGTVTLLAPKPALALTGLPTAVGTLALRAPLPALTFSSGGGLALRAPQPTLSLTGTAGSAGAVALRAPLATLTLTGASPVLGTVSLATPQPQVALAGISGQVGVLTLRAPLPSLLLTATESVLGTVSLRAPQPTMALSGYYAATGALVLRSPLPGLQLTGTTVLTQTQADAARVTLALQTVRGALTQYTNFPFNSFAFFGGRYLAASSSGIFSLGGDTDNGTPIAANARLGITDLNTSHVKRVERVYVGGRSAGQLVLRVITDDTQQRDYAVPLPAVQRAMHGAHVRVGKGVEARYWQFEVRNQGGADFTVDAIEVRPTVLPRRTGVKDA